jgi:arabinose-5-phosphate isomerase
MTVSVEKGFKPEDFANLHPGGKLGKRLMRARQLMHAGEAAPVVSLDTVMRDIIYTMSSKGLGMTSVVDTDGRLAGIITDGDLRRRMEVTPDIKGLLARDVMTSHPITITAETLAVEALALLEQRKITSVVVIDADRRVEGVLHLHDLWRTEMV